MTLQEAFQQYQSRAGTPDEYLSAQGFVKRGEGEHWWQPNDDGGLSRVNQENLEQQFAKTQDPVHYISQAGDSRYMAFDPGVTLDTPAAQEYQQQGMRTVRDAIKRYDPGYSEANWLAPNTEQNPFDRAVYQRSPQYNHSMDAPETEPGSGFGEWLGLMAIGMGVGALASGFLGAGVAAGAEAGAAAAGGLEAAGAAAGAAGEFALVPAGSGAGLGGVGTAGLGLQVPAASSGALLTPAITGGATGIGAAGLTTGATAGGLGLGATAPSGALINDALLTPAITGGATGIGPGGLPIGSEVSSSAATASGINAPSAGVAPPKGIINSAIETVSKVPSKILDHVKNNPISTALGAATLLGGGAGGSPAEQERTGTAEQPSAISSSDFGELSLGVRARPQAILRDRQGNPVFKSPGTGFILSGIRV